VGLAPAEPGVEPQQLPGVDVADRDDLGEPAVAFDAGQVGEERCERVAAPLPVQLSTALRELGEPRRGLLGCQQPEYAGGVVLVVLLQDGDGGVDIADRARSASVARN
jgi:hypothetical protein